VPDDAPIRWQPDRSPQGPQPGSWALPSLGLAVARGLARRCPVCGQTRLFRGYLTVTPRCLACGTELGRVSADDAPPYFTIVVVGHIVIPLLLWTDRAYSPPIWLMSVIFVPLTLVLCVTLLPFIKGGTVGLMLKLGLMKPENG
jgi:uncharacterized protein (DUF983 family)